MKKFLRNHNQDIKVILASVWGALFTYILYEFLGFNNVIAASVTGIFAGLIAPFYAAPCYMGAFVGMVSSEVIKNIFLLVSAGFLAGFLFIGSKKYFSGFGGKLGAMAFISILIVVFFTQFFKVKLFIPAAREFFWGVEITAVFVLVGAAGAYFTNLISENYIFRLIKTKYHNRVLSSALVGLFAGMVFPSLLGNLGVELATLIFVASFVGMTSHRVFSKDCEYFFAGGVAGLVYAVSGSFFPGFGGKAGSIAFVAVIIFVEIYRFIKKIYKKVG